VLTVGELRAALDDATAHPGRLCLVQAVVPRDDVPDLLSALTAVLGRAARSTS
jgi:indolepyruvate decarboxylase